MPYASFRYWISFVSLALGFAIGLVASLWGTSLCLPGRYIAGTMSSWDDDDDGPALRPRVITRQIAREAGVLGRQPDAALSITGIGVGIALMILVIVWLL